MTDKSVCRVRRISTIFYARQFYVFDVERVGSVNESTRMNLSAAPNCYYHPKPAPTISRDTDLLLARRLALTC